MGSIENFFRDMSDFDFEGSLADFSNWSPNSIATSGVTMTKVAVTNLLESRQYKKYSVSQDESKIIVDVECTMACPQYDADHIRQNITKCPWRGQLIADMRMYPQFKRDYEESRIAESKRQLSQIVKDHPTVRFNLKPKPNNGNVHRRALEYLKADIKKSRVAHEVLSEWFYTDGHIHCQLSHSKVQSRNSKPQRYIAPAQIEPDSSVAQVCPISQPDVHVAPRRRRLESSSNATESDADSPTNHQGRRRIDFPIMQRDEFSSLSSPDDSPATPREAKMAKKSKSVTKARGNDGKFRKSTAKV